MTAVHLPPSPVRTAFWLWMAAIATALVELAVRLAIDPRGLTEAVPGSGPELLIRFAAYALLLVLATLMRRGGNVARHLLTVVFGGLGTLSLVAEPVGWIAGGGDVGAFLAGADAALWTMIVARALHVAAVLGAVVLAYLPASNAYFRRAAPD